ncbi:MAG: ImmA/IrrE family metallo-endopeptidase [Aminobacteriaceae bacterium]
MNTVPASIPVLRWAAERARLPDTVLERSFRKWVLWLSGDAQPTLKQLEDFARLTRTPIGYFFLPEPPVLQLPIPDFRTLRDEELTEPSIALLDTLYLCQQRQDWYRGYSRVHGLAPLDFVSSTTLDDQPEQTAGAMRQILGLSVAERRALPTWTDALRQLISKAEDAGILVMTSSIVGSNSRRKLDVAEFRGFALVDDRAPLIFINGSDSKAAQMFTLAHELSHIWLGESGVSNPEVGSIPRQGVEGWCNRAAAELLMPLDALHEVYEPDAPLTDEIQRLAHLFKVSSLVALRRLYDADFIDRDTLWMNYRQETARIRALDRGGSGGNFYRTLSARTGKRFASAVLTSTLEGQTLFLDAFRLLGMRKTSTLYEAARELGVMR